MANNEDRPIFILKIGKEGLDPQPVELPTRVHSFKYEDDEKKPGKLTMTLANDDFIWLDSDVFKKGNIVQVSWGYHGNLRTEECVIHRVTAHFGSGEFTLEADHVGFQLHKNKRSRDWLNKTRSEVAREIAENQGFSSREIFIEDTKVRHEVITQAAMTDAELLKRMANAEGFRYYIDASGFHFHQRKWNEPPVKTLRWFTDSVGEIIDGSFESESKKKKGRVKSEHIDPITKKPLVIDSKNDTVPRESLASVLEHVDEKTGQTTLQARLADDEVRPSVEASPAAAKTGSDAAFKEQQKNTLKLKLDVVGDPKLHAKCLVEVTGIGKRLSGLWHVEKCTHEIDTHYVSKLEMIRDGHHGYKGVSKDAKSSGSVNDKKDDGLEARQIEVVDKVTGESHFEWKLK